MKTDLLEFISNKSFPCIMAKAAASLGNIHLYKLSKWPVEKEFAPLYGAFHEFIEEFRKDTKRLSSFIIGLQSSESFEHFEDRFWSFLMDLRKFDRMSFLHDKRVSEDPLSPDFSFSIMGEAFFILVLHPESPRLARRFKYPAIVFNPHQQFENLRRSGRFHKIRNRIRKKDFELQGAPNPMLQDFGVESEIFQYLGRVYHSPDEIPFLKETA